MGKIEDSRNMLGRAQEESFDNAQAQSTQIANLRRKLVMVTTALENCQSDIISNQQLQVKESMTNMSFALLQAHIPSTIEFDEMMLNFIKLLERNAGKATGLYNICNKLFVIPQFAK